MEELATEVHPFEPMPNHNGERGMKMMDIEADGVLQWFYAFLRMVGRGSYPLTQQTSETRSQRGNLRAADLSTVAPGVRSVRPCLRTRNGQKPGELKWLPGCLLAS